MGLISKHRKKFVSHKKRWDKETIVDEKVLVTDYALKNKKEIRKIEFIISKYKDIAKELNRSTETKQSERAQQFIGNLQKMGYLTLEQNTLDDVLGLELRNFLERRLSNILYKRKLARSPRQARQFVVHGHVQVGGKVVTSPSFFVPVDLEPTVEFVNKSTLADEEHPERKLHVEGYSDLKEEMEQTPLVEENGPDMDKKEAQFDDEEQDEVKE